MLRRLAIALLAVVLTLSGAVTALAAGKVTYSGDAGEFIFEPGSEESPTDLFTDFKDVMPGDSLEQTILVKNDASKNIKVKIYMRVLGAHEDSVAFLSQLHLRVEKEEDEIMFDAAADQTAQLTDWVCLGTLYSGGELELKVILDVPVTLGNEFQKEIGFLDWEFKIEEYPVEDTDPEPPQTGDESNIALYMVLAAASGGLLLILLLPRKKKEEPESSE